MPTCEIRWIDTKTFKFTPDENPPVQLCRTKAYIFVRDDGTQIPVPESQWFLVCAEHSKRLPMEGWETKPIEGDYNWWNAL